MSTKIFIGGIGNRVDRDRLEDELKKYGEVKSCELKTNYAFAVCFPWRVNIFFRNLKKNQKQKKPLSR
jgi:RNA recognition motif-containing protein